MVIDITAQASALRTKADETLLGMHDPLEYNTGRMVMVNGKREHVKAPFADAGQYKQAEIRKQLAWVMQSRAKDGESFAKMMSALADKVHGTELAVVAKPQPAERIQAGEKRINAKGLVMTAVRQDGQRLHFSYERHDGKTFTTWMSPRSWRTMQMA
jgi:hypothetical protein